VKTGVFLNFLLFVSCGLAQEQSIPNSASPDKHFSIAVEEGDGRLSYRVKEIRTGRNRISFPSAYQPEPGELPNWSYEHALAAEIHWRADSRCVALDEANHNRIGTVLMAYRTKRGFRRVPLNCDALMRSTGEHWDRGRLFFGAWQAHDRATVYLIGKTYVDPKRSEHRRSEDRSYTFTVDLAHDGRVIRWKHDAPLE
jgi:hypothetical protein